MKGTKLDVDLISRLLWLWKSSTFERAQVTVVREWMKVSLKRWWAAVTRVSNSFLSFVKWHFFLFKLFAKKNTHKVIVKVNLLLGALRLLALVLRKAPKSRSMHRIHRRHFFCCHSAFYCHLANEDFATFVCRWMWNCEAKTSNTIFLQTIPPLTEAIFLIFLFSNLTKIASEWRNEMRTHELIFLLFLIAPRTKIIWKQT